MLLEICSFRKHSVLAVTFLLNISLVNCRLHFLLVVFATDVERIITNYAIWKVSVFVLTKHANFDEQWYFFTFNKYAILEETCIFTKYLFCSMSIAYYPCFRRCTYEQANRKVLNKKIKTDEIDLKDAKHFDCF